MALQNHSKKGVYQYRHDKNLFETQQESFIQQAYVWHVHRIPIMKLQTGIPRATRSKSHMISSSEFRIYEINTYIMKYIRHTKVLISEK